MTSSVEHYYDEKLESSLEDYSHLQDDRSLYEYDPEKQKTFSALIIAILNISITLAGIGVVVKMLFISKPKVYMMKFSLLFAQGGSISPFQNLESIMIAVLALKVLILSLSVLFFVYFAVQKYKESQQDYKLNARKDQVIKVYSSCSCILECMALVFIILAFLFAGLVAGTVTDPVDLEIKEDTAQKMFDFQVAIFNKCCFEPGFSEQGEIAECVLDLDQDCNNLPEGIDQFQENLCACYDSSDFYNAFLTLIESNDLCQNLNDVKVKINQDTAIPGIPISISFIIGAIYGGGIDIPESGEIPVVGFQQFDPNGGDQFGCGIGYAKGLMFILSLWFEQNLNLSLYILIGASIAQLLLAVMNISCMKLAAEEDFGDGDNFFEVNRDNLEREATSTLEKQQNFHAQPKVANEEEIAAELLKFRASTKNKRRTKRRLVHGDFIKPRPPQFDDVDDVIDVYEDEIKDSKCSPQSVPLAQRKRRAGKRRERKPVVGDFIKRQGFTGFL